MPFRMGRELGGRHPAITRFVAFEGVDHSGLPKASREIIYEEFAAVAPRSELVHSLP